MSAIVDRASFEAVGETASEIEAAFLALRDVVADHLGFPLVTVSMTIEGKRTAYPVDHEAAFGGSVRFRIKEVPA